MEPSVIVNKFIILILILFISACGRQVNISSSKLESYSKLTDAEIDKDKVNAVLFRLQSSDNIQYSGKSYQVSAQSSHLALTYIKTKTIGSHVPVKVKAKFKGTEVIIEVIEDK